MDPKMCNSTSNEVDEKELSALLENAFEQFSDIYKNDDKQKSTPTKTIEKDNKVESDEDLEKIREKFKSLFESGLVDKDQMPTETADEIINSMQEFIQKMKEDPQKFANDSQISKEYEEKFSKYIASLNSEETCEQFDKKHLDNLEPLMTNIMENLLCKEFLYPTLSDLCNKYPNYLKENKNELSGQDYTRYKNQLDVIKKICILFEDESENDSESVKSKRFEDILSLMKTMQSYGSPPSTLVPKDSMSAFDPTQFNSNECSLM